MNLIYARRNWGEKFKGHFSMKRKLTDIIDDYTEWFEVHGNKPTPSNPFPFSGVSAVTGFPTTAITSMSVQDILRQMDSQIIIRSGQ